MALISAGADDQAALVDEIAVMDRRLWLAAVATLPVFTLAMGPMIGLPISDFVRPMTSAVIQLALASVVMFGPGLLLLAKGLRSIRTRQLNMFTLIALGTATAWAWSVAVLVAIAHSDGSLGGVHDLYFESVSVILTLVLVGQVLELRAQGRTRASLLDLLDLAPDTAPGTGPLGPTCQNA